jgi:hypothetical protein
MSGFRGDSFDDRRKSALEAKKALMEHFRTNQADPNDPAMVAKREAAIAREEREREKAEARRVAKKAEAERLAKEKAERAAEREIQRRAEMRRKLLLAAEQKRQRDAIAAGRKPKR